MPIRPMARFVLQNPVTPSSLLTTTIRSEQLALPWLPEGERKCANGA
jgi:hypothetical protein